MTSHDTHSQGSRQTRKATASGWVGPVLEYYDFFIYAQAAALIFAQVFFPSLMNVIPVTATAFGAAYAVQPAYGIGFSKRVYLWIPVVGRGVPKLQRCVPKLLS